MEERSSFFNLTDWLYSIKENTKDDIFIILIGNKSDLKETRTVKDWELEELATKKGLKYFETSAKDNQNINEAFFYLVENIIKKGSQKSSTNGISLFNYNKIKKVQCCSSQSK